MWITVSKGNIWHILNTVTGKSKAIGPVKSKGSNNHDKANAECLRRNLKDFGKEVKVTTDGLQYDRNGNYIAGQVAWKEKPTALVLWEANYR